MTDCYVQNVIYLYEFSFRYKHIKFLALSNHFDSNILIGIRIKTYFVMIKIANFFFSEKKKYSSLNEMMERNDSRTSDTSFSKPFISSRIFVLICFKLMIALLHNGFNYHFLPYRRFSIIFNSKTNIKTFYEIHIASLHRLNIPAALHSCRKVKQKEIIIYLCKFQTCIGPLENCKCW